MSQRQSEGFIIQNVNQQPEEQMIPISTICLFILVEMFLPGRYNRPSAYAQYGFRDGFTHTARNTIYFAGFMLFLGVIFILICCCYQYVALCSKRNRSSNTEL
ncbi:unnamed protein product [Adineta steineri]|uniref:Uncharacterized protein n=1 Tax=Adineta steineri TaxID=433720 RepID=A0A815USH0_9BILA|nr:unnamed protein product [Adineta steineri]CAF1259086.1 unnamed protein product [Adineta steineri]CAF1521142.1 unnamed protein product [Adineta steineri]CAF1547235.1 unnamed protein product [Adineta steineri]